MHTPNTAPQPDPCRPLCNVIITSCSAAPPGSCSGPHLFQCGIDCYTISGLCDGYNNCVDGSDEKNCCKLMVIVTVVVVQSATDKSNLAVERLEDVPLVEFMYLVFTRMSGELPQATQVFVVVLV